MRQSAELASHSAGATPPRLSRRALLAGGIAAAAASATPLGAHAGRAGALTYVGVNLAGAEFGAVPGLHGRDYAYPARHLVDYYASHGFNLIRLPFGWERLQPGIGGELALDELIRLTELVDYASARGVHVVLDPHNYAHRRIAADGWSTEHRLGSAAVPASALSDLWSRLAHRFKGNSQVIFGLMNEPKELASTVWLPIANRAVAAIRAAGAPNLVLVPGVAYTGAHSWIRASNTVMAGLEDPADNFAFEVHQYLDQDSSGTSPEVVSPTIGSQRIEQFQSWARAHGFKAFLGEFGAAAGKQALQAVEDLCQALEVNSDVWLGWAAWAGGTWWPDHYMFKLDPFPDGRMRAQTAILAAYARRR